MFDNRRLQVVLNDAAMTIELLYKELDRKPPMEGTDLIAELRQFALLMEDGCAA